jgi:hypothetical protein
MGILRYFEFRGKYLCSLISLLARFSSKHRLDKKYLIVPSYQTGHQIEEALAKEAGAWVNLHFVTLPSLAQEVAGIELSRQRVRLVLQANGLFLVDRVFRRLKAAKKFKSPASARPIELLTDIGVGRSGAGECAGRIAGHRQADPAEIRLAAG